MKSLFLILLATFLSAHALADDLTKPDCKQPTVPNPMASDLVMKQFTKKKTAYDACINKFIDEQREIAKTTTDVLKANLAHDAAESAVKEYNDYMEVLNARTKRANSLNGDDGEEEGK
jgi:hypothetical protein